MLSMAYQQVTPVVSTLKKMRDDSSSQFHSLFSETTQLGQKLKLHGDQFELSTLQGLWDDKYTEAILKHQVQRTIFESTSSMNFFLMSFLSLRICLLTIKLILLLLAFFIFSQMRCVCVDNDGILPIELAQAADMYKEDLPHPVMLSTEYNM